MWCRIKEIRERKGGRWGVVIFFFGVGVLRGWQIIALGGLC